MSKLVYIYCEDTTSGYDFIKTLVRRVWKKDTATCIIKSLSGSNNCNSLLNSIYTDMLNNITEYNSGDVIIFYFDISTLNVNSFFAVSKEGKKKGVNIYLQSFFCFETAFFTYTEFIKNQSCYFGINAKLYNDYRNCLNGSLELELFKQKYKAILDLGNLSLEESANSIFSFITNTMPCIKVNKHSYNILDFQLNKYINGQEKDIDLFYYNNLCNKLSVQDRACNKFPNYIPYCQKQQNGKRCLVTRKTRGYTRNLLNFYENSCLSEPFYTYKKDKLILSNKTLKSLVN